MNTATIAEVAEALKLDRSSASRRVTVGLKKGYLQNLETKRGQPHRLVPGDALPGESPLMPTTKQLREGWKKDE